MHVRLKACKKEVPIEVRNLDEELLATYMKSVEELDLKVLGIRAYNCIKNAKIETLGELAKKTTDDVLGWKNSGTITVGRIKKALKPFGLSLDLEFVSLQEEVGKLSPVSNLMYPLNE